MHRPAGQPGHLQPLPDRLGGRLLHALPHVQALHLPGRRLRPAGDLLAGGDQGAGRGAPPVPPLHRHRPDHPGVLRRRRCRRSSTACKQTPLSGVSMRYSFDNAEAPTQKETQYYEMMGNRGHLAPGLEGRRRARPDRAASGNFDQDRWQLFHTDEDRAEAHDLADEYPGEGRGAERLWHGGGRRSTTCCR